MKEKENFAKKTKQKRTLTLTMANPLPPPPQIQKFPQFKYIDSVRWLPSISPFEKSIIIAFFNSDTDTPSLETHSLSSSSLTPLSSWNPPSRISSLKSTSSLIAAATFSGSLFIFPTTESATLDPSKMSELLNRREYHVGPIRGVDVIESEVVSVGEDGRVNLVRVFDEGKKIGTNCKRVFDGNGLVSYNAVKWASTTEFVTGGFGFGLQRWDLRRPNSSVAQFKGIWDEGLTSGIIHSIDIHPSRKHTCLVGGSSGTVFAWDIRWPQEPIILSGVGTNDATTRSLSESDVWEVQYDCYAKSSSSNVSSSRILPAMICSEDGILAVIEQGEEPIELLAEPCAINSFDIDPQNPSDVICSLEWESIATLSRP